MCINERSQKRHALPDHNKTSGRRQSGSGLEACILRLGGTLTSDIIDIPNIIWGGCNCKTPFETVGREHDVIERLSTSYLKQSEDRPELCEEDLRRNFKTVSRSGRSSKHNHIL